MADNEEPVHPEDQHKGNLERTEPGRVASAADAALDEVRAIRAENEARAATHNRVETHATILGKTTEGNEPSSPLEIHAVGGQLFVNSHGEKVLSRDDLITLRKELDKAFQAVS